MSLVRRVLSRVLRPLQSRKVRVAVATAAGAWLADEGFDVSPEVMYAIIGVGLALILGIAHEDNGAKSAGNHPAP
jgi:hypothetical protein